MGISLNSYARLAEHVCGHNKSSCTCGNTAAGTSLDGERHGGHLELVFGGKAGGGGMTGLGRAKRV